MPARRRADPVVRLALGAGLLACAPRGGDGPPTSARAPREATLAPRVIASLGAAEVIHWRGAAGDGARCATWRLEWEASEDGLLRGRARREEGEATFSLALSVVDARLVVSDPRVEVGDQLTAVACTYSGRIRERGGQPIDVELRGRERWYLDADACAGDDQGAAIRPLGCASTLADPETRRRLAGAPATDDTALPAWLGERRAFLRSDEGEGPRCAAWRRRPGPAGDRYGVLERRSGGRTLALEYAYDRVVAAADAAPIAFLTLAGPSARARVDGDVLVESRGCLISREVDGSGGGEVGQIAGLEWHRSRRSCEAGGSIALPPPCLRGLDGLGR